MIIALAGAVAYATSVPPGAPGVVITSDCEIDGATYLDFDADGTDDFVAHVSNVLYVWPTSRATSSWALTFPSVDDGHSLFDIAPSTYNRGAQVAWRYGGVTEYEVQAESGLPVERVPFQTGNWWSVFVGDVDGDGRSDLANQAWVRPSTIGDWSVVPGAEKGVGHVNAVGDLDQDGDDELLVAWREWWLD